jgi:hypothetical protein
MSFMLASQDINSELFADHGLKNFLFIGAVIEQR